jgi:hypothetical protein
MSLTYRGEIVLPQETSVIAAVGRRSEARADLPSARRLFSYRQGTPLPNNVHPDAIGGAASLLRAVGAGLIASTSGPVLVVLLLPAMTTQLMMSVPPLSFKRHLFNDNRPRLGERRSLRAVMPGSEKNRANNGREHQYFF